MHDFLCPNLVGRAFCSLGSFTLFNFLRTAGRLDDASNAVHLSDAKKPYPFLGQQLGQNLQSNLDQNWAATCTNLGEQLGPSWRASLGPMCDGSTPWAVLYWMHWRHFPRRGSRLKFSQNIFFHVFLNFDKMIDSKLSMPLPGSITGALDWARKCLKPIRKVPKSRSAVRNQKRAPTIGSHCCK